jgi:hypothetical protein
VTAVVIFSASDRPEVGPWAHLPVPEDAAQRLGPTVLRTVCGRTGIGRLFDREDTTCPLCWAVSGRHPGKRGKLALHRQYEEATRGR